MYFFQCNSIHHKALAGARDGHITKTPCSPLPISPRLFVANQLLHPRLPPLPCSGQTCEQCLTGFRKVSTLVGGDISFLLYVVPTDTFRLYTMKKYQT